MTPMFLPSRSANFWMAASALTMSLLASRKIRAEKSTLRMRVCVAVVFAQSRSALPDATICRRSVAVPASQLHLEVRRADGASELVEMTLRHRSIEYPVRPLVALDEGERQRVAGEGDVDLFRGLDLRQRVGLRGRARAGWRVGGGERGDDHECGGGAMQDGVFACGSPPGSRARRWRRKRRRSTPCHARGTGGGAAGHPSRARVLHSRPARSRTSPPLVQMAPAFLRC